MSEPGQSDYSHLGKFPPILRQRIEPIETEPDNGEWRPALLTVLIAINIVCLTANFAILLTR